MTSRPRDLISVHYRKDSQPGNCSLDTETFLTEDEMGYISTRAEHNGNMAADSGHVYEDTCSHVLSCAVSCSHVCGVAEHGAGSACRTVHNYYQWVPYMLVLCGLLFTLPHQLWRHLEEGRMESVARGVRDSARWGTHWSLVTLSTLP